MPWMTAVSEIIKTQIFQKNTQKPRRDLKNPDLVGKTQRW